MASGFLDSLGDAMSTGGRSSHRRHSSRSRTKKRRSPSRSRSRSRSVSRSSRRSKSFSGILGDNFARNNASRGSFFGLGNNFSRSSLFGSGRPSYYKRSPRSGFVSRATKQLKRLFRDLAHYAKRHPWKVFFMVIVPLLGALTALLARFGLRIPGSLERMLGMASRAAKGDAFGAVNDAVRMAGDIGGNYRGTRIERGRQDGVQWERTAATYANVPYRSEPSWTDNVSKGVSNFFS